MASYRLTIAGVQKNIQLGTLSITSPVNQTKNASVDVTSEDGSYRPDVDAEVIIEELIGASPEPRIFGGLITSSIEKGLTAPSDQGIITSISAQDFNCLTQRRYVNETIPEGSLKSFLVRIQTYLDAYGVTLDPAQVDGPTIPQITYTYGPDSQVMAILNSLSTLAASVGSPNGPAWVWEIDAYRVLRMFEPGTIMAPANVALGEIDPIGDLEVETTRDDQYANRVIVVIPPVTKLGFEDVFVGDGVTTVFPLSLVAAEEGSGFRGTVLVDGVNETLGASAATWVWDLAARPQTITDTGTGGVTGYRSFPAGAGADIRIIYDGVLAVVAIEPSVMPATPWEKVLVTSNLDANGARALAKAELVQASRTLTILRYPTHAIGLQDGQTQNLNVPQRNLNDACLITQVDSNDVAPGDGHRDPLLKRQITLTKNGAIRGSNNRDVYKAWMGGSGGGGGASTSPAVVGGVGLTPGNPDASLQRNEGGVFRGTQIFWYDGSNVYKTFNQESYAAAYSLVDGFDGNRYADVEEISHADSALNGEIAGKFFDLDVTASDAATRIFGALFRGTAGFSPSPNANLMMALVGLRNTAGAVQLKHQLAALLCNPIAWEMDGSIWGTELQTVTNAEVLTLPSAPYVFFTGNAGAKFPGYALSAFVVHVRIDTAAGVYSNIDPGASIVVQQEGGGPVVSAPLVNDAIGSPSLAGVDDLLGAGDDRSVVFERAIRSDTGRATAIVYPTASDLGLELRFDNGGAGNLTGGDSANVMTIHTFYQLVPLAA